MRQDHARRTTSRREFMDAAGTRAWSPRRSVRRASPPSCRPRCSAPPAPSNRINVGAIGTGRISRGHDLPGIWKHDSARIMAVCDLDSTRVRGRQDARQRVLREADRQAVRRRHRLRRLPRAARQQGHRRRRHQHARSLARAHRDRAVEAGKDVYLQKPASLTIAEGRALSNAVHRSGRIFQIGSQQRSSPQFRYAAELVRNGRIGQLKTVEVGLPGDPVGRRRAGDAGAEEPELRHVARLDAASCYYTEKRVHPQTGYDRPGWLRCEQFGAGHDHRLGRASHRQRALGDGHRVHGPGRDLGHGGVPDEGPVGRARPVQDRGALRQRRPDDRQRRLSRTASSSSAPRAGSSSRAATRR